MMRLATILVCASISSNSAFADDDAHSRQAAFSLAKHFETVVSAEPNVVLRSWRRDGAHRKVASPLGVPFEFFVLSLDALADDALNIALKDAHRLLVGTKDYRVPAGFGLSRSQNCYILVLSASSNFDLAKYGRVSRAKADVWRWSAKIGEFGELDSRPSTIFATQISESFLLLSNDRRELELIERELKSADRRLAEDEPLLSELFPFSAWGYRIYRHDGVPPKHKDAAGLSKVTREAKAVTFFLDRETERIKLRFYCSGADPCSRAGEILGQLENLGKGVWQRNLVVGDDEQSWGRLLYLMAIFGFVAFT